MSAEAPEGIPKPPFHYHLVLVEPLIPPNTGNAGRLAVATQCTLHIVGPAGFSLDDKAVRRAGLDYWKYVDLQQHATFDDFLAWREAEEPALPLYLIETGGEQTLYDAAIPPRAAFIFGKETTGLDPRICERFRDRLFTIPMFSTRIRSLNLANTVTLVLYEAVRQNLPGVIHRP